MSKFKNEVKATLNDFKELYTHDWHEFSDAWQFYKQAFRDFSYATKRLLIGLLGILCLIVAPFLIPFALMIRMIKK